MGKTVRIIIDDETHKQAKAQAALAGMTLAAWIAAAIAEKAARTPATTKGVKPMK